MYDRNIKLTFWLLYCIVNATGHVISVVSYQIKRGQYTAVLKETFQYFLSYSHRYYEVIITSCCHDHLPSVSVGLL